MGILQVKLSFPNCPSHKTEQIESPNQSTHLSSLPLVSSLLIISPFCRRSSWCCQWNLWRSVPPFRSSCCHPFLCSSRLLELLPSVSLSPLQEDRRCEEPVTTRSAPLCEEPANHPSCQPKVWDFHFFLSCQTKVVFVLLLSIFGGC